MPRGEDEPERAWPSTYPWLAPGQLVVSSCQVWSNSRPGGLPPLLVLLLVPPDLVLPEGCLQGCPQVCVHLCRRPRAPRPRGPQCGSIIAGDIGLGQLDCRLSRLPVTPVTTAACHRCRWSRLPPGHDCRLVTVAAGHDCRWSRLPPVTVAAGQDGMPRLFYLCGAGAGVRTSRGATPRPDIMSGALTHGPGPRALSNMERDGEVRTQPTSKGGMMPPLNFSNAPVRGRSLSGLRLAP